MSDNDHEQYYGIPQQDDSAMSGEELHAMQLSEKSRQLKHKQRTERCRCLKEEIRLDDVKWEDSYIIGKKLISFAFSNHDIISLSIGRATPNELANALEQVVEKLRNRDNWR